MKESLRDLDAVTTCRFAAVYIVLVIATLVVPRAVGRFGDGFQASTSAAVAALGFAAMALTIASWLFGRTIVRAKRLSRLAVVVGLAPLPVSLAGVGLVWLLMQTA